MTKPKQDLNDTELKLFTIDPTNWNGIVQLMVDLSLYCIVNDFD